jgi:uncharacterized membrane protein YbjE (DUF340 family)
MAWQVVGTVLVGIAVGHFLLPAAAVGILDTIVTYALAGMVLCVGIDIGRNKEIWQRMRNLGGKVLLVPLCVVCGTMAGAGIGALFMHLPLKELLAVAAGLGWYSLSGVLIAQIYSVELGTIAFLANVFREIIAFMSIPFLARYISGVVSIAPGGATTMDSTLPLITKTTNPQIGFIAFLNGLVLSAIVPFLVPFILQW